jgi:hypothetical protein
VRGARRPITARELAGEVMRQKFPTTSKDIPQLVKSQVSKLTPQGIFQRAKGQPGVVLAGAKGKPKPPAVRAKRRPGKEGGKKAPSPKTARNGAADGKKPSLRTVLTELLAKRQEPVAVSELAAQAKAQGYRSQSKNFKNVLWVALRQMDNVENVPGRGYRLKKR